MARYTLAGASIVSLVAYARHRGADLTPALREAGLRLDALAQPEARVPLEAAHVVWEAAARHTGDPDFGLHYAERLDLDAFHVVGHLARNSRTVGEALRRVVDFSRLLHDGGRTELERRRGQCFFFPGCRGLPQPPSRQVAEFNAASAVALTRFVTRRPSWAPRAVHFEHPAPADVATHLRVLGVAPTFGQPETMLVLDPASLDLPVREQAPSKLGEYLEGYARALLRSLPAADEQDVPARALRVVVTSLTLGVARLPEVAAQLGTTPRSLQRALAAAGTSFGALVDEARLRTAQKYLEDPSLPLAEVSYLVGFKEPSTFHKAFRRWTGKTPGSFRAAALGRR